jgi:hypothetical protein
MANTTLVQTSVKTTKTKSNTKGILSIVIWMFVGVICLFLTNVDEASAADVTPLDSTAIIKMVDEQGSIFMVGENEISRDVSVSEIVQQYKAYREAILGPAVCMYARNNQEMKPTAENVMELRNQFTYCDQEVTVQTDKISGETKVLLERVEDSGRICYTMYSFDQIKYQPDVYAIERVVEFNYLGFSYVVYIENGKFEICSVWNPEVGTRVYDINELNNEGGETLRKVLKRDLKKAFDNKDVTFIEELGYYVKIHAFTEFDGIKREYVFYTYNAKPTNDVTEIIASVKTIDDEYTIYEADGWICIDSAKRSGYADHPNAVKVS